MKRSCNAGLPVRGIRQATTSQMFGNVLAMTNTPDCKGTPPEFGDARSCSAPKFVRPEPDRISGSPQSQHRLGDPRPNCFASANGESYGNPTISPDLFGHDRRCDQPVET